MHLFLAVGLLCFAAFLLLAIAMPFVFVYASKVRREKREKIQEWGVKFPGRCYRCTGSGRIYFSDGTEKPCPDCRGTGGPNGYA